MQITYDPEADAMYIKFNDKQRDGGWPVTDSIIIHTDEHDELTGIQLLGVSKFADDIAGITEKYHIDKIEAEERTATNAR